ncbi:MAG: lipid-A-disaccharide synthase [Bacteroidia bacterium]|nr:lipid-A-disaccharide synthase [Bacteroidia bacterium]
MKRAAPRVMIIAGEASGDQYGARVLRALKETHPESECFGIGGDLMKAEGVDLLFHISQTAIMGFVEVAKNAGFLRSMFRRCREELALRKPDVVVLIDYPGFNLRFAKRVREAGIKVLYYISPQVWAWGKGRIAKMRDLVDHLAVVFPFEAPLFRDADVPVTFVGHPLLEILNVSDRGTFCETYGLSADAPILGLLPGSRQQEIDRLLPAMLDAATILMKETGCQPAIGASQLPDSSYQHHLRGHTHIPLLRGATHALMQHSRAVLVASGTATVETALYETPMVIVYRASFLNYQIGKRLIQIDSIGMPNILAGKRIVPELLQDELKPQNIADHALPYFTDPARHAATVAELHRVRERMGTAGASRRVAELLLDMTGHSSASTQG